MSIVSENFPSVRFPGKYDDVSKKYTITGEGGLKAEILAFVGEAGPVRAGEVGTHFGVQVQKASALLKQLVEAGKLERYTEKKVTFFKVAEA